MLLMLGIRHSPCVYENKRFYLKIDNYMRETVRSISGISVRILRGAFHSTRGPGRTCLWCASSHSNGKRWVAMHGEITAESI
jgi:urease accessory protein UreE